MDVKDLEVGELYVVFSQISYIGFKEDVLATYLNKGLDDDDSAYNDRDGTLILLNNWYNFLLVSESACSIMAFTAYEVNKFIKRFCGV